MIFQSIRDCKHVETSEVNKDHQNYVAITVETETGEMVQTAYLGLPLDQAQKLSNAFRNDPEQSVSEPFLGDWKAIRDTNLRSGDVYIIPKDDGSSAPWIFERFTDLGKARFKNMITGHYEHLGAQRRIRKIDETFVDAIRKYERDRIKRSIGS